MAEASNKRERGGVFVEPERRRRPRLLRRALGAVCALVVVITVLTAGSFAYLYWHYSGIVDERLASGYLSSRAGLYAAPRTLRAGHALTPERLAESLRRAGYVEGEASRVWNGRFRVEPGAVEIWPGEAGAFAAAQGFRTVRVEFDGRGRVASLRADGETVDSYTLEPEPLTHEAGVKTGGRDALSYEDIPATLARAILSVEDRRFFEHGAVDLRAVARAALSWGYENQDLKQGGSTITQQLAKNTYLTSERTLRRKFQEAALAAVIERRIGKRDIFALYCNEIYLGRRGSIAVRGVRQAARVFFGKELKDLTLAESATIAGMIQSPGRYAPDRHADAARLRRATVLAAMRRDGWITEDEERSAAAEPVAVAPLERADASASHFIDYVNRAVEERAREGEAGGLRVYTTIDLDLQRAAEEAVAKQVSRLEKVFKGRRRPEAALVALDPRTGRVLALVGGNSYAESQLNRATDARRQPGSVFKPVVYAAAMEAGISPLSVSLDAPRDFTYDLRSRYRPANYGGAYSRRDVTLREALARSLNVVTVDVALRTGLDRVASLAERLGLPKAAPYPSLALGAAEATPLEVAAAYTAFARGGRVARPTPLLRVEGDGRDAAFDDAPRSEQVLKPSTSYMLTDMLAGVVTRGTARAARGAAGGVALAGKTGTARDGWFAGYTPNLVCVVWVGFDDGEELGLTGAESALPAWVEFVRRAVELRPELGGEHFERPQGVVTVEVDAETGALAGPACPRRESVALAPALAPRYECMLHAEPLVTLASLETVEPAAPTAAALVARRDAARYEAPTEPIRAATRVEIKRDGRPVLTNDFQD
ncbi:MAG TPA: PBP1A family penicillin-binding protein [Pyrinomonadaceae bacterium]|nr:PBP1A family penicillin-binding protein [Pyrinomonadaceae bacterium]